ncbi:monooxygenase family protein [Anthocerotibacter panamensis]|uniref:monooxygenase family protein n=1 Tax=Anthocerotibacter panamensis TaxID=2857077 RepID=UPI001C40611B|nr:DUF4188 domain-containing protein [Anthocerotibacter panamensis]
MAKQKKLNRSTVDLSAYPDLVVVYLGMRVTTWSGRGLLTLIGFGPKVSDSVAQQPDGLLLHEPIIYSLYPPHFGMRQYWQDYPSLEAWARSAPHRQWWEQYIRDTGGTGFWHELYYMKGGMEAVYDGMDKPIGFLSFAPNLSPQGPMFSSRQRLGMAGKSPTAPVPEEELYQGNP